MSDQEKVMQAFKDAGEPINAGKVVEMTGLDRKVVDKIMAQLKADELIISPKRCCWTLK
jgi:DNA-binding IscR family transcriptional regulator